MRILIITTILLLTSCVPVQKEAETTSSNINSSAPYLWANNNFPKNLHLSENFTDAEVENILEMSEAWKTAVQDKRTFFAFSATKTAEITNTINNMDSLLDSVLGIYKTTHWPPSLPGSALAVTQIFGRRHNVGSSKEFVNIEHADILINEDIHNFDTGPSGINYDLRTVILHELGHFLGMQHRVVSNSNDTVMYPSIGSSTYKRAPRTLDINDLADKYGIALTTSGSTNAVAKIKPPTHQIDPRDAGQPVKILLELHADGECVHRMDGRITHQHSLNTKDNF